MRAHLLVTLDYPPARGGVARYYHALVHALPDIRMRVLADKDDDSSGDDALVTRVRMRARWALPHWLPLLFAVLKNGLSRQLVLHVGQVLPVGTCAWLLHLLNRTPYVVYTHGLDVRAARRSRRKAWFAGRVLRAASFVVANSKDTASVVGSYGVAEDRILIVYPGCTLLGSRPDPVRVSALTQRWHATGRRIILSVGRLVPRKGFANVLRALALLQDVADAHCVIVGNGPEESTLRALAASLGVSGRVTIDTGVQDADLPNAYAAASVFALTPQQTEDASDVEGFGIVFLEAGAFGVPSLGVRTGGVAEAVDDGVTGLLLADASPEAIAGAIRTLFTDETMRRRLGTQAQAYVQRTAAWSSRVAPLAVRLQHLSPPHDRPSVPPRTTDSVSVIIPVYQGAHTITRCLESIFRQTIQPSQVLVVNDGSTDQLHEALAPYRGRITVIDQQNRGANAARNRGAHAATGNFLLFCDADVILGPTFLERMLQTLHTHPEASYAYASFRFGWKPFHLWPFSAARLRRLNYIHTTSLLRREHFPAFDESLRRLQDWDVWLTMLAQGHTGVWIPETLFSVLVEGKGISSWFPGFLLRIPWHRLGIRLARVERYRDAERVIREKHGLHG